jgi:hypothetical protein
MIDMNSPLTPLTIQMQVDLVAELQRIAAKNGTSVDELVQEACAQLVEPYSWEAYASEWDRAGVIPPEPDATGTADTPSAQP